MVGIQVGEVAVVQDQVQVLVLEDLALVLVVAEDLALVPVVVGDQVLVLEVVEI